MPGSGPQEAESNRVTETDTPAPEPTGAGAELAALAAAAAASALLIVADVRDRIGLGLLGIALLAVVCWVAWFTAVRRLGTAVAVIVATLAVGVFGWVSGSPIALAVPWLGALVGMASPHRRLRLMTLLILTVFATIVVLRSSVV